MLKKTLITKKKNPLRIEKVSKHFKINFIKKIDKILTIFKININNYNKTFITINLINKIK